MFFQKLYWFFHRRISIHFFWVFVFTFLRSIQSIIDCEISSVCVCVSKYVSITQYTSAYMIILCIFAHYRNLILLLLLWLCEKHRRWVRRSMWCSSHQPIAVWRLVLAGCLCDLNFVQFDLIDSISFSHRIMNPSVLCKQ